jgi:hypothetical protein
LHAILDDAGEPGTNRLQAAQVLLDYDGLVTQANMLMLRGAASAALRAVLEGRARQSTGEKLQAARAVLDALLHKVHRPALAKRLDRTSTATDGYFHFLDLPDGDYTLIASLPGVGIRYGVLFVSVFREAIGVGDGTTESFRLSNYPVLEADEMFVIRVAGKPDKSARLQNEHDNSESFVRFGDNNIPGTKKPITADYTLLPVEIVKNEDIGRGDGKIMTFELGRYPVLEIHGTFKMRVGGETKSATLSNDNDRGVSKVTFREAPAEGKAITGDYCPTGPEAGERTVVVSARGYADVKKTVKLDEAGQAESANFKLSRK